MHEMKELRQWSYQVLREEDDEGHWVPWILCTYISR